MESLTVLQHLQELAGTQGVSGSGTGTPGPPSYEVITQGQGPSELPPPSYAEAVALLQQTGIHDDKPCCGAVPCSTVDMGEAARTKP